MRKYLILAIITGFVTYFLRENVSLLNYGAYKDTLGALLNISSIIFAIIGAWIAIIYPRAIGRVFNETKTSISTIKEADADASYLSELVEIVMVSAIVLMLVLSIQFIFPIVKIFLTGDWIFYAKQISFFVISVLTLSQLYAVFRVIMANYFFLNELRNKNANGKIDSLHR